MENMFKASTVKTRTWCVSRLWKQTLQPAMCCLQYERSENVALALNTKGK